MRRSSKAWGGVAAAVLVALAACKDSTSPTIPDPGGLAQDLAAAESIFFSPTAVQSFGTLGSQLNPTGSALAQANARFLNAVRPLVTEAPARSTPQTVTPEQEAAVRALAAALRGPSGAMGPIIPDSLYGRTFEWDTATNQYADTGRAGAPATGVRFILYQVDQTNFPVEPVVEVGQADFIDQSGLALELRVIVAGVGGDPQYVNYVITGTSGASSSSFQITGQLSNGSVSDLRTLTFTMSASESWSGSDSTASIGLQISLNQPAVTLQMQMTLKLHDAADTVTLSFSVTRQGQTVSLQGFIVDDGGVGYVDITIRVNGRTFAVARGTGDTAQFEKPNGDPLTQAEAEAVFTLLFAPFEFLDNFGDLFEPGEAAFGP